LFTDLGERCEITFRGGQFAHLVAGGIHHELELFIADVVAVLVARDIQEILQQRLHRLGRVDLYLVGGMGGVGGTKEKGDGQAAGPSH
jgi:hypothetical protein